MAGIVSLFISFQASGAITVTIDTSAAKADLAALRNASLTREEALEIARLPGNQGAIRKENEFGIRVTDEVFATALVAAAQGRKVADPREVSLYFDLVKPKIDRLMALVETIDADPAAFQESIRKRIALFTPPDADISLQGYVLACGDGGGYAFGDTRFYLNLLFNEDTAVARTTTAHELYHAVQGAFAKGAGSAGKPPASNQASRACADTAALLRDVYEEGSAVLVEDPATLTESHSETAARQSADLNEGRAHLHESATLLELSVAGLQSPDPVPFDDVYAVGFHGHGVLYDIGYAMASAIVDNDGPQGLAAFLGAPPYRFALRYTQLPRYGADKDHPKLGPHTLNALNRLASGCK